MTSPIRPTNGFTTSAAALRYWERRQAVVSNNLANASTDGFKAQRVFGQMLDGALPIANAATDLSMGTIRPTGNALDVALERPGFLVVDTPAGERWSRGGAFQLDAGGRLADAAGHVVMGEHGPIVVTEHDGHAANVSIDKDGAVSVDGVIRDRLRIERQGADAPQHEGDTLFVPTAERTVVAPGDRGVRQGALEDSNVSTIGSMVDMIEIQRAYSAVQKALTALDGTRGTCVNEIGKPV